MRGQLVLTQNRWMRKFSDFLFLWILIEEFYCPSYTVTIASESQFHSLVMSLSAGISQTRKHCSRMPTARFQTVRVSYWTNFNMFKGIPVQWGLCWTSLNMCEGGHCTVNFNASWVMVTCPPSFEQTRQKKAGGKKLTSPLVWYRQHQWKKKKKKLVLICCLRWHCADLRSVPEFALMLRRAAFPFITIFH